jgi:hypothetical protein
MGKLVIEFLLDEIDPSYEDLLNKIQVKYPWTKCILVMALDERYSK